MESKGTEKSTPALAGKDEDQKFLYHQSKAVRAEIMAQEERAVRTQMIALSGIPLLTAVGKFEDLQLLLFATPILTAVMSIMVLYMQTSIMRCGRYLRIHIDPKLKSSSVVSWEEFLERDTDNRVPERHFRLAVTLTFAIYYVAGVVLIWSALSATSNGAAISGYAIGAAISGYAIIFLICLVYAVFHFQVGNKDEGE